MMTKTTIRSNAKRKQNLGLTVTQATTQARRYVDKVMPGVGATVDSKSTWDVATDAQVIITTITFPAIVAATVKASFSLELAKLAGNIRQIDADSSIVVTRTV